MGLQSRILRFTALCDKADGASQIASADGWNHKRQKQAARLAGCRLTGREYSNCWHGAPPIENRSDHNSCLPPIFNIFGRQQSSDPALGAP
jgi:hypothetical protein